MVMFIIALLFATTKFYWKGFNEGYNKAREDEEEKEDEHAHK